MIFSMFKKNNCIIKKATVCPYCSSSISKCNLIKCGDRKKESDISMVACQNYGCSNLAFKQKKKKHRSVNIFLIVLALIGVSILGIVILQKAKELEYYSNMEAVSYTMLNGAAKAETAGNLIKNVWYNAIYEERDNETDKYTMKNGIFVDDFNDALSRLFADESFINSISEIETNQYEVTDLMKRLKNPPKKYEEAYSVLMECYDNYLKMTRTVISPTGSLNTFSEDFNTYDNDTGTSCEKMKLYLD